MVSDGAKGEKKSGKGFAGLSSMVSNVDAALGTAQREKRVSTGSAPRPKRSQAASGSVPERPPSPAVGQPSSKSSTRTWLIVWVISVGVGVPLMLLGWPIPNNPTSRSLYPSSPATTRVGQPASRGFAEERPPVGTNLVLGAAQLRYCLSEDIRLQGAKRVLNLYSETDVRRFNTMVDDYNSRCGSFRYHRGSLESAKRDVEQNRFVLEAAGRTRFTQDFGGQ